jgi:hypothetical protein
MVYSVVSAFPLQVGGVQGWLTLQTLFVIARILLATLTKQQHMMFRLTTEHENGLMVLIVCIFLSP